MRRLFNTALRSQMPAGDALLRWAGKGFWAVADQGLFSTANFLVNILLARWLAPEEYGAFAVALSVYYLLMNFYTAVLTEPMLVFGAGKYREQFPKYLGMLLYGHWGVSAVSALLLAVAALLMQTLGSKPMAQALAGLAIAAPFLLLLLLIRRSCYVEIQPQWAVWGSGLNLAVTLGGLFLLWRARLLSSLSGLVLLGAAAVIASLPLLILRLRPLVWGYGGNPTPMMVLADHRSYGRWSVATVVLMWIPGNVYYALLPVVSGLEGSASLRALHNLVLPMLHAISAVSVLLVPYFSETVLRQKSALYQHVKKALMLFILMSFVYWLFIGLSSQQIIRLLYGERYFKDAHLLLLLGLLPVSASVVAVIGGALRAMERPDQVFFCYIFSTITVMIVGIPLTIYVGLPGAIAGQLLSSLTTAGGMMWFYSKHKRLEGGKA